MSWHGSSPPEATGSRLDPESLRAVAAVVLGVLAVYTLVALCVHCFDIEALKPIVLCWRDVCQGRGCCFYKFLCCPFVLLWNSIRIFCGNCCGTYLRWIRYWSGCEGCCWKKFTDPEFPPAHASIGVLKGDTASGIIYMSAVEWKRASEICARGGGGSAQLFEGEIEAEDLHQGAIGDCWLIAALACVAERPEIVQRTIRTAGVDPRGRYKFRLWNQIRQQPGTEWVDIVIDDFVPVDPRTGEPKFARAHGNEMWAMLLEKAFAKMYGSYSALEGGCMSWALSALTGNPALAFDRRNGTSWRVAEGGYYTQEEISDHTFFDFLRKSRRKGAFICCSGIAQANRQGLIHGHAYSVLNLRTVRKAAASTDYFRMVQIRNPHGGGEWTGSWSDRSPLWQAYPRVKERLVGGSSTLKEDGAFWMQWQDFVRFWQSVDVVDCETTIDTVAIPLHDSQRCCGPLAACLRGCCYFWCCCVGAKRLFLGRAGAQDLQEMKEGLDQKCGYDREGFYCELCERRVVEASMSSDSDSDSYSRH